MRNDVPFEVWSRERQQRIEHVLDDVLRFDDGAAARLHEAMRYSVLGGGKRMRPLLAYAAGEIARADPQRVDAPAAAVELIHAYSLIHDDLPCMDDDTLRRGKPTCHIAYGEATALLAGDALQALAFGVIGGSGMSRAGEGCALLAEAAGAPGMAGGQQIDLAATGSTMTQDALEQMHRMKTGALIRAAVHLGVLAGGPLSIAQMEALDQFARAAGLAFQVVDDVLDVEAPSSTLGKTSGKDAAQGKPTFVSLLGVAAAREYADRLRMQAHSALAPFASDARRLHELADWIVLRTH
jgi:farnesyl diphosphate synthase